jgi:hypothetical protein
MRSLAEAGQRRYKCDYKPYKVYREGTFVFPKKGSILEEDLKRYYQRSKGILFVVKENVSGEEYDYKVRPIGYHDEIKASHGDLIPEWLVPSRLFMPVRMVRPGVAVAPVVRPKGKIPILMVDSQQKDDFLVEILVEEGEPREIEYYAKK